ncbi:MAG: ATP synthase F1 subunit gamma [Candidatus Paceibacterota bacterium]
MASTKEIKRRIKSVKSTKKITKAMELVAASKMKRAISRTLASRLYSSYSWDLLTSLSERLDDVKHKFFVTNTNTEKSLIVLITSNRGLCGGYNSQVIKKTITKIKEEINSQQVDIITVGKKGDNAMRRTGQNVVAAFTDMPDNVSLQDILPLSTYLTNEFKEEKYGKVYIAYTDFVSALTQKPTIRQILPISKAELKETIESIGESETTTKLSKSKEVPYIFEGDTEQLLTSLAEKLIRMQIYQMLLESNASEQSSRMVAMKNANEAAGEMIDDLTLVFNKARQAGITREISEISAGMASVN